MELNEVKSRRKIKKKRTYKMMKVENDIQVQQIGILSMIDNNEMFKTKNY